MVNPASAVLRTGHGEGMCVVRKGWFVMAGHRYSTQRKAGVFLAVIAVAAVAV
jgi:hypothetical protein